MRADSAFYGHAVVGAAVKAGAEVSVTVRLDKKVKAAIAAISEDAWTTIAYPNAVFDEPTGRWISRAEVAEIDFVAFTSKKKADQVPGRLVVRRIPDLAPKSDKSQASLFEHVAPPRVLHHHTREVADTVAADKIHRGHAIIEQVHADLKDSALAHLPSGKFNANAAWLVLAVTTPWNSPIRSSSLSMSMEFSTSAVANPRPGSPPPRTWSGIAPAGDGTPRPRSPRVRRARGLSTAARRAGRGGCRRSCAEHMMLPGADPCARLTPMPR